MLTRLRVETETTFRSLRHRNYRLMFIGAAVSNIGTWMQRIAQDLLVLHLTGSGLALGVVTTLQFIPALIVAPHAGVLADRYPKRRILQCTNVLMTSIAAVLGALTVSGHIAVGVVYVCAVLTGLIGSIDGPTRSAFVFELVGRDDLPNAIGLNAMTFYTARIVGPAIAGLMVGAWGSGVVFLLNAASFTPVLISLQLMDPSTMHGGRPRAKTGGAAREGIRYLLANRELVQSLALTCAVYALVLNFQVTITLMAIDVFGKGAGEFGVLTSVMAVGSLAGSLVAARRGTVRFRFVCAAAVLLGALYVVAGLAPSYVIFGVLMLPIGIVSNTYITSANSYFQSRIEAGMQGRVMGLFLSLTTACTPIGSPAIGWLSDHATARWALYAGGVLCIAAGVAVYLASLRGVHLAAAREADPQTSIAMEGATP
jgi:MFS family permease